MNFDLELQNRFEGFALDEGEWYSKSVKEQLQAHLMILVTGKQLR